MSLPEEVGLSTPRLGQISRWSDGWVAAEKIPFMLTLIARRGKLCYVHASGTSSDETGRYVGLDTIVRMYSMTKPVVSVAAMVLYERGLFQLDEPITKHLPIFANPRVLLPDGSTEPAARDITFRDLLMHTAGLSYGDGDSALDTLYDAAGCGWDAPYKLPLDEFVRRLATLPLAFQPGFSWRYSYATDLLGYLLEILSGMPLDELLEREVFGPLLMHDSGFHVPEEKRDRFAQIYEVCDDASAAENGLGESERAYRRFERYSSHAGTHAPNSPSRSRNSINEEMNTADILAAEAEEGEGDGDNNGKQGKGSGGGGGGGGGGENGGEHGGENAPNARQPTEAALSSTRAAATAAAGDKIKRSSSVPTLSDMPSGSASRGYRRGYRAWRQGAAKGARGEVSATEVVPPPFDRTELAAAFNAVKWRELRPSQKNGFPQTPPSASPLSSRGTNPPDASPVKLGGSFPASVPTTFPASFNPNSASSSADALDKFAPKFRSPRGETELPPTIDEEERSSRFSRRSRLAQPAFKPMGEDAAGKYGERPQFLSAGGGMVSTAHDYARFCQMLLNFGELDGVQILSRKTVEFMVRNHLPLDAAGRRVDIDTVATDSGFSETSFDGVGFGLGWAVMTDPIKASIISSKGEFGWGGWASTFFLVDREEDMTVISLSQLAPSDRYPIRRQLRCLVYQSLLKD